MCRWCLSPPYSAASPITNDKFIQDLAELMERLPPTISNILLLGDVNIHLNKETDPSARLFKDMTESLGLHQGVLFSTHTSGNTLDLIISRYDQVLKVDDIHQGSYISDNRLVQGCMSLDIYQNYIGPKVLFTASRTLTMKNWIQIWQMSFRTAYSEMM